MKTRKIYILLFVLSAWTIQSCTDGFEDLNRDPKNPTVAKTPAAFNLIISKLNPQAVNAVHHSRYNFQTQLLGNAKVTFPLSSSSGIWDNYYQIVRNIRLISDQLEEYTASTSIKTTHAKACLDILYAYRSLEMADYFGDYPFTDGGKGLYGAQYYEVEYNKHQDIYKHCMELLKQASEMLNTPATDQYSYGGGDTFLKNDYAKWRKFANALMLRYAIQLFDADATYSSYVSTILGNAGQYPLLTGTESIGLWPKDMANQLFDYHGGQWASENPMCMGSAMWRQMSDNDAVDGSGIFDPRAYVFFETNKDDEWKAQPQNPAPGADEQGVKGPYSDGAYPDGRNKAQTYEEYWNKGDACLFSPVNYYLVQNKDFIPDLFATAAEMNLLKAEAYARGIGVAKNPALAKAAYEEGIMSSLGFWYHEIVERHPGWHWYKPVWNPAMNSAYMTREAYSNDEATALKQIYKQLWIDLFRQPNVVFNLYRRTLNTPKDTSGNYNAADYNFYTCPYPESERNYNTANFNKATDNGKNNEYNLKKLFWHK